MWLQDGRGRRRQVVPAAWIARVSVRDPELIEAYGEPSEHGRQTAGRLLPRQLVGLGCPRGVCTPLGMNGQCAFVHRPSRTVIVKFSTFPDALDWELFALHHAGMVALCEHLA